MKATEQVEKFLEENPQPAEPVDLAMALALARWIDDEEAAAQACAAGCPA